MVKLATPALLSLIALVSNVQAQGYLGPCGSSCSTEQTFIICVCRDNGGNKQTTELDLDLCLGNDDSLLIAQKE
jgi:hypothetical protein